MQEQNCEGKGQVVPPPAKKAAGAVPIAATGSALNAAEVAEAPAAPTRAPDAAVGLRKTSTRGDISGNTNIMTPYITRNGQTCSNVKTHSFWFGVFLVDTQILL